MAAQLLFHRDPKRIVGVFARTSFSRSESLPFKNRMSRAPQSFKQRDMTCAIKAAQAAGLTAYRIEIVNGNPAIIVGGNVDNPKDADVKSWDEAIAELESRQ